MEVHKITFKVHYITNASLRNHKFYYYYKMKRRGSKRRNSLKRHSLYSNHPWTKSQERCVKSWYWKHVNLFLSGKVTYFDFCVFWKNSVLFAPGVCGMLSELLSFLFAPTQQPDLWGALTHTLYSDYAREVSSMCGRAAQPPGSVHSTMFSRTLLIVRG